MMSGPFKSACLWCRATNLNGAARPATCGAPLCFRHRRQGAQNSDDGKRRDSGRAGRAVNVCPSRCQRQLKIPQFAAVENFQLALTRVGAASSRVPRTACASRLRPRAKPPAYQHRGT